jgi:dTDP-4-dehydrorhamnose 3,5-epimerase
MNEVRHIKGDVFTDERGVLQYVNDFDFTGVKRFYQIIHPDASVVRAWQGHQVEHKWFFVGQGSFLIAWVKIDDWDTPSKTLKAEYSVLSAQSPQVISIPPGYANGIKALEPGSVLTVFSNLTVDQSSNDRWSFDPSLWMDWSQF